MRPVWQRIAENGERTPALRDTATWAQTSSPVLALTVCRGRPCRLVTFSSTTAASLAATRSWKKSPSSAPT